MTLLTTKLSHSSNSVKKLSSLHSKFIYLKYERNLSYQGVPPKYTFDIYKRAPFSPWHKTQTTYILNGHCPLIYSYSTITNAKNLKRDHFRQCLEGLNYNAYNQRLHARALSSSQVKSNNGPSKLKQFGIAIIFGMAAGGGEMKFVLNSILIDRFLHKTCFNFNAYGQSILFQCMQF